MAEPHALLADRYRLVRQVGSGGMGVVWEAWDERLERPVAVKQLRPQLGLTPEEAELTKNRAMREARITARLHHRNAVPVFDVVEHEGQPCLIMQFLPSVPLSAVLREGGPLSVHEAAKVGAQVASALAAAHQLDIVHRDVKPGNILIADDGTALISDFGISHALGDATLTSTGLVHGTPAYLAPEVARGADSGFASDVFSLGATLYACLEGGPPFGTDPNSIALLHKVASGEFAPPQRAGELTPVLMQMLQSEPEARPVMKEVASRLAAVEAGAASPTLPLLAPDPLPEPPRPDPDPAWARRRAADVRRGRRGPGRCRRCRPVPPAAPRPWRPSSVIRARPAAVAAAPGPWPRSRSWSAWPSSAPPWSRDSWDAVATAPPPTRPRLARRRPRRRPPRPSPARGPRARPPPPPAGRPPPRRRRPGRPARPARPGPRRRHRRSGEPTASELENAITSYYALVPGDTDRAWPLMTADYQRNHAGGRQAYQRFWDGVDRVSVSDVKASPPSRVDATITYRRGGGRVDVERTSYRLVREGGTLKIADSTVLSGT